MTRYRYPVLALMLSSLFLTACTPGGTAQEEPSSPASSAVTNSAEASSSGSSAAEATAGQNRDAAQAGSDFTPTSELLAQLDERLKQQPEYTALSPQCKSTVTRLSLMVAAPLALMAQAANPGLSAQDSAAFDEANAEVSALTPAELEPVFNNAETALNNVMQDASTSSNMPDFEALFQPVNDWMRANCQGFSANQAL